jgi:hypothetical protein
MPIIFSTASASAVYLLNYTRPTTHDIPHVKRSIKINGGANVAVAIKGGETSKQSHTPLVGKTIVTEEELQALLANKSFQRHIKRGFISFENNEKVKEEKMLKNMTPKDKSAPVTNPRTDTRVNIKPEVKGSLEHLSSGKPIEGA